MKAISTLIKAIAILIAVTGSAFVIGVGPAKADTQCRVNASGAMWCVDMDTGQSWEQSSEGSYPDNPYCSPYVHRVQCGD
jgi:hypothetical protein